MRMLEKLFRFSQSAQLRFDERFVPLQRTVFDANAVFSGSIMSADLQALRPLALRIGETSRAMGDLLWLEFLVLHKREQDSVGLPLGLRALEILDKHGTPSVKESFERHYTIGQSALAAEDYSTAIAHLRQAATQAELPDGPLLDPSQRLSIQEDIGFALHEDGLAAEALTLNRNLLAAAQTEFGPGPDARLAGVLNNLAQNAYVLGDTSTAQTYLKQRLRLGLALHNDDISDNTLFQLGVLAHEAGDNAQAREYFEHRIALARASDDEDRLEIALNTQAEFEQRMSATTTDQRRPSQ